MYSLTFSSVFGLSQVPDNEDEWRSEESGQQKLSVTGRYKLSACHRFHTRLSLIDEYLVYLLKKKQYLLIPE